MWQPYDMIGITRTRLQSHFFNAHLNTTNIGRGGRLGSGICTIFLAASAPECQRCFEQRVSSQLRYGIRLHATRDYVYMDEHSKTALLDCRAVHMHAS